MRIKPLDKTADKWQGRAAVSAGAYEDGVRNPRTSWAKSAYHAFEAYKAGIQASIQNRSYTKGVHKAGDSKWQDRAIRLGVPRWPQGIAEAGPAFIEGFGPYHAALSSLKLPPRYARGDPRNLERVKVIAEALHRVKLGTAVAA